MSAIFISYRRSDSQDVSGRIYDRLVASLSAEKVFKDVDNIPLSVSFPDYLSQMLKEAKVVLVIIGTTWYSTKDSSGRRRLDDPEDVVRIEVETALRLGLAIVPVLVSNAAFQPASELPESMRPLALRNGLPVRPDPDFHHDMDRLIRKLEVMIEPKPPGPAAAPAPPTAARLFKPAWAIGFALVLAMITFAWWKRAGAGHPGTSPGAIPATIAANVGVSVVGTNSVPVYVKDSASIAVLPFENIGAEKDNEYFSDGISEEILNSLARVPGLKVLARSASFSFKGKNEDVRHIGQALNVSYALEGSVRRAGTQLRISTHLVKVSDGVLAWSENFDREAKEILKIQDEVAQRVVETLKMKLLPDDAKNVASRGTANLVAYDFYLQGRFQFNKRTGEGLKLGIASFNQAIAKDPDYAAAYASLGACYLLLPVYENVPSEETVPNARAAINRALELDNRLAEAHTVLGKLKAENDWDWPGAEREFKQAIRLNPNSATAHHWYSLSLSIHGRASEAADQSGKAEQLDPISLIIKVNSAILPAYQRRYDESIKALNKILELDPNFYSAAMVLIQVQAMAGKYHECIEGIEKLPAGLRAAGGVSETLGYSFARLGRIDEANQVIKKLEEISKDGTHVEMNIALVRLGLGEFDQVYPLLEKAIGYRDPEATDLIALPIWDPMRHDPRYLALLKKMGAEN
jgi:serine/threonine-protein kinase